MQNNARIFGAETVGTAILMIGGLGTVILAPAGATFTLSVALAFGLSYLVLWYAIGPISGCHLNPAVTLGMWLARKVNGTHAFFAVIGQFLGGAIGAFIVWGIANGVDGYDRGSFGANGFSDLSPGGYGLGSVIVVEVLITALFVMMFLFTTSRKFNGAFGGVVIGLSLTLIHLVTLNIDGTSTNPVRSFSSVLFATIDSNAAEQYWVFLVFPLLGAVLGVFIWLLLDDSRLEDTLLDAEPLRTVRDVADDLLEGLVDNATGLDSHDD